MGEKLIWRQSYFMTQSTLHPQIQSKNHASDAWKMAGNAKLAPTLEIGLMQFCFENLRMKIFHRESMMNKSLKAIWTIKQSLENFSVGLKGHFQTSL